MAEFDSAIHYQFYPHTTNSMLGEKLLYKMSLKSKELAAEHEIISKEIDDFVERLRKIMKELDF